MARHTQQPLRIGLLVDPGLASKYIHDIVVWANTQTNLQVACRIVLDTEPASAATSRVGHFKARWQHHSRNGWRALGASIFFHLLERIEARALQHCPRFREHRRRFDLQGLIDATLTVVPILTPSGRVCRLTSADLQKVRELELDILIRFGSKILRGDILNASRLGILSFHHGDNRINRGGPPGFWEVYKQSGTSGFTLQRLTEELDGGDVLMRGNFPTRLYYQLNQASLFEKSNVYLKDLLRKIALDRTLPPFLPAVPFSKNILRSPTITQTTRYIARLGTRIGTRLANRAMGRGERWHVAFVPGNWRDAALWRGVEIPNPPYRFLADPFVISRNGRTCCFVEDLDYRARRGRISVFELGDTGATELGVALTEPFHLSFPFLFEFDGALYMCPETSANRDIRVYRCIDFPLRWELAAVLMTDVESADTMLVEHDGRWWMLTNIDPSGSGDLCSELYVFWADSPLATEWTAHPGNPVLIDADGARNGGLILDGGRMFRVGQRQGFDLYGQGARISEITELSSEAYQEETVATIDPDFSPDIQGTHHLHSNGHFTVFDFLRSGESWQ